MRQERLGSSFVINYYRETKLLLNQQDGGTNSPFGQTSICVHKCQLFGTNIVKWSSSCAGLLLKLGQGNRFDTIEACETKFASWAHHLDTLNIPSMENLFIKSEKWKPLKLLVFHFMRCQLESSDNDGKIVPLRSYIA